MRYIGLSCWILLLSASTAWAELRPEQVAIIAMADSPTSRDLASYYAKARSIPESHICLLPGKYGKDIRRQTWEDDMRPAIVGFLAEHGLTDQVRCLVTVWDVPLRISQIPSDAPVLSARKNHLKHARAEKLGQMANLLAILDTLGAGDSAARKPPFAADVPLQQVSDEFARSLSKAQQRVQSITSAEQKKKTESVLERIFAMAGGNNGISQMLAMQASATPLGPEQRVRQAFFAGRGQGLGLGLDALNSLPESVARDQRTLELLEATGGLFAALKWIDEQTPTLETNQSPASFDSELALALWYDHPVCGWLPNPWHYSNDANPMRRAKTLMVARLAAPTPEVVRRMIDDAVATEKTSLQGKVYLDAQGIKTGPGKAGRGSRKEYDQSLRDLASRLTRDTSLEVVLDDRSEVFAPGTCPNAALYCGWYSLGKYVDAFDWAPGAVGYHIASNEAFWLRNPNPSKDAGKKAWCPAMLEDGACATLGPVMEPYLLAFPLPDDFFPLLLTGKYTLAEVFYRTSPFNSWAIMLVGDPLYNPYKHQPALAEDKLPERLRGPLASAPEAAQPEPPSSERLTLPGANP